MIKSDTVQFEKKLSEYNARFMSFLNLDTRKKEEVSRTLRNSDEVNLGDPLTNPTFIDQEAVSEISKMTLEVCAVLKSIPKKLFKNDYKLVAQLMDEDEVWMKEFGFAGIDNVQSILARGDYIQTSNGFKCLEYNFGLNLGGWQSKIIESFYMNDKVTQSFITQNNIQIQSYNTIELMIRHFIENTLKWCKETNHEINIVMTPKYKAVELKEYSFLQNEYQRVIRSYKGMNGKLIVLSDLSELTSQNQFLYYGVERIHAIVNFSYQFIKEQYSAFNERFVNIFHSPISVLLNLKSNFALLSENETTTAFSEKERDVIRKYIPWTRIIKESLTKFDGVEIDLIPFCYENQKKLVLKEVLSSSGKGVFIGKETSIEDWQHIIEKALKTNNYIVQEYHESVLYPYLNRNSQIMPHKAVWGLFAFGDIYGGGFLRVMEESKTEVINTGQGAVDSYFLAHKRVEI